MRTYHPQYCHCTACVTFLEDLFQEMVDKKSNDPFGTIRVARKALSKLGTVLHH